MDRRGRSRPPAPPVVPPAPQGNPRPARAPPVSDRATVTRACLSEATRRIALRYVRFRHVTADVCGAGVVPSSPGRFRDPGLVQRGTGAGGGGGDAGVLRVAPVRRGDGGRTALPVAGRGRVGDRYRLRVADLARRT